MADLFVVGGGGLDVVSLAWIVGSSRSSKVRVAVVGEGCVGVRG